MTTQSSRLPAPFIYDPSKHAHLLPQLAQVHADCVLQDGTMATFLPRADGTMDMPKLLAHWEEWSAQVVAGSRDILIQLASSERGDDGRGEEEEREEVAGYVSLYMEPTETGSFRGMVEKLLVSPRHRRKGVATAVMRLLEVVALRKHRELLMLGTTIGSYAEHFYPLLGYKSYGVIPNFGFNPATGKLADEIFYYKDLRDEQ